MSTDNQLELKRSLAVNIPKRKIQGEKGNYEALLLSVC